MIDSDDAPIAMTDRTDDPGSESGRPLELHELSEVHADLNALHGRYQRLQEAAWEAVRRGSVAELRAFLEGEGRVPG